MQNKIKPSQLLHIWKLGPCDPINTLSGGAEEVACLEKAGLVELTGNGYIATATGRDIVNKIARYLDTLEITLVTDIAVHTPLTVQSNYK